MGVRGGKATIELETLHWRAEGCWTGTSFATVLHSQRDSRDGGTSAAA